MSESEPMRRRTRTWIVRGFGAVEDVTYVGLGLLLASLAIALLVTSGMHMVASIVSGSLPGQMTALLDRILLALLIVELLYTVQVSFREHAITPEPFLVVGLIAGIRRMLLITAEYGELHDKSESAIRAFSMELLVLTVLTVALVASLVLLRKKDVRAERG